jgi:hypothetical protein
LAWRGFEAVVNTGCGWELRDHFPSGRAAESAQKNPAEAG